MKNIRSCKACNYKKNKYELYRIVKDVNNNAVIDKEYKVCSRAFYVCKEAKCLNILLNKIKKGKLNVKVDVSLDSLEKLVKEMLES